MKRILVIVHVEPSHPAGVLPLPWLPLACCSDPPSCVPRSAVFTANLPEPRAVGRPRPAKGLKFADVPNGLAALSKVGILGAV